MALDPLLFDTYKRYKAGTLKLVSWLADMARKTGLVDDMFPPVASSAGSGKGKGKNKGKRKTRKSGQPKKYQILMRDFTRMARAVTDSSSHDVPSSILRTLRDTIAARRRCARWFTSHQKNPNDTTKAHNEGHQHFIQVLEEVFEILNGNTLDFARPKPAGSEAHVEEVQEPSNIFDYLEVEDPAEWSPEETLPIQPPQQAVSYEIEPSDEELSFAIFCFFKDLVDIHHFVRQTWAEYREHRITLTTAAVTMNAAIDVFRRLNEDFVSAFPRFDEHPKIVMYLYDGYCDRNTGMPITSGFDGDIPSYQADGEKLPTSVFFCDHTFEMIQGFFLSGKLPFYNPHPTVRLTQDEEVLLKCLFLFGLMDLPTKGDFMSDQLIKGLSKVRKDKKVYTWVVLAVPLFVDARRVVGKELGRCMVEFGHMREYLSSTLRKSRTFNRTNNVDDWYKLNGTRPSSPEKGLEAVAEKDIVQDMLDIHFGPQDKRYSWGHFFLFSNHPMLCGLIIHEYLCKIHRLGVSTGGDQGAIITAIHLYNAAHQSNLTPLSVRWADLDYLIAMQGPAWLFIGERPQGLGDCFMHYSVVMGTSATIAAKYRNGKSTFATTNDRAPRSQQGNRKLRVMSQYVDLTFEHVGNRVVRTRAADDVTVMLEMMVAKCLEKECDSANADAKKEAKHHRLIPLQMLSIFKESLQKDELPLSFDLFALNQRCIELLRRIQTICLDESPADYPYAEYATDSRLNSVVAHMLAGVGGVPFHGSTRFAEACQLLQEVAEREGDVEHQKATARCAIDHTATTKITEELKTPAEDVALISDREMFSNVVIVGEDGSVRMI